MTERLEFQRGIRVWHAADTAFLDIHIVALAARRIELPPLRVCHRLRVEFSKLLSESIMDDNFYCSAIELDFAPLLRLDCIGKKGKCRQQTGEY